MINNIMPSQLWLGSVSVDIMSGVEQVNSRQWFAEYGKTVEAGGWSVRVYYDGDKFFIASSNRHDCYIPEHLSGKQLYTTQVQESIWDGLEDDSPHTITLGNYIEYKDDKMARFENGAVAQTVQSVKDETVDVAQITIGKLLYTNGGELVSRFVPSLKWYEKLFTSSKKRELALLVGTYVAIKIVQNKYDHYLLQSVSAYINFQLQTELLGGVTQDTLDKLFSKFEAVS